MARIWEQFINTAAIDDALSKKADLVNGKLKADQLPSWVAFSWDLGAINNALSQKENKSDKNKPNGYAGLDGNKKLDPSVIPLIATTENVVVANKAARLKLTTSQVQKWDYAIQSDDWSRWVLVWTNPALEKDWVLMSDITPDWSQITNKPTNFNFDDTPLVHKAGEETITGVKIFENLFHARLGTAGDSEFIFEKNQSVAWWDKIRFVFQRTRWSFNNKQDTQNNDVLWAIAFNWYRNWKPKSFFSIEARDMWDYGIAYINWAELKIQHKDWKWDMSIKTDDRHWGMLLESSNPFNIMSKHLNYEANTSAGISSLQMMAFGINGSNMDIRINRDLNVNFQYIKQYGRSEWWYPMDKSWNIKRYDCWEERYYYDFNWDVNTVWNAKKATTMHLNFFEVSDSFTAETGVAFWTRKRLFIDYEKTARYAPAISLAIGDNDTGFNRERDWELSMYANNQKIQVFNTWRVPIVSLNWANRATYELTQQQFDAIWSKDSNIIYYITEN